MSPEDHRHQGYYQSALGLEVTPTQRECHDAFEWLRRYALENDNLHAKVAFIAWANAADQEKTLRERHQKVRDRMREIARSVPVAGTYPPGSYYKGYDNGVAWVLGEIRDALGDDA